MEGGPGRSHKGRAVQVRGDLREEQGRHKSSCKRHHHRRDGVM